MSGFPNRPPRVAFGPEMKNKYPPQVPEKDLSAEQMNLLFWQAAGAGRTLPAAIILFDGATPAILYQALAMDPKQELGDVDYVKTGTGDYTFSFNGTYDNQAGSPTAFVPRMAIAVVQGATGDYASPGVPSGQDVTVTVFDVSDVPTDATFILAVW